MKLFAEIIPEKYEKFDKYLFEIDDSLIIENNSNLPKIEIFLYIFIYCHSSIDFFLDISYNLM